MFCTMHGRAAKPPSRVIQPGWLSDLRASRFLSAAIVLDVPARIFCKRMLRPDRWMGVPFCSQQAQIDASSLPQSALETIARVRESGMFPAREPRLFHPKNGISSGLPGRANATIRSRAAPRSIGSRFGTAPSQAQSVDVPGIIACETAVPRPAWWWRGRIFAPFVYRLGRHPFTVERAVRFR